MTRGKSDRHLRKSNSRDANTIKQQQQQQQQQAAGADEEMDRALAMHMESSTMDDGDTNDGTGSGGKTEGSHLEFDPFAKHGVAVVAPSQSQQSTSTHTTIDSSSGGGGGDAAAGVTKQQPPKAAAASAEAADDKVTKTPRRRATITIKLPIPTWGKKWADKPQALDDSISELS